MWIDSARWGLNRSAYWPLVMVVFAGLLTDAARAAELTVQIVDANTQGAVSNAAVCLGTAANPSQFGALQAGYDGQVTFEGIPAIPLVLTASQPGYRGRALRLSTVRADRFLSVPLQRGGLGPSCNVSDAPYGGIAGGGQGLRIEEFDINAGGSTTAQRQVVVDISVAGQPTHYRISEDPQFRDAQWLAYVQRPRFQLSPGRGSKTVYLQVRRLNEVAGASLQSVSAVAIQRIVLE